MKMIVEKQMECRLAGETEVLGENLPQRHFCQSDELLPVADGENANWNILKSRYVTHPSVWEDAD
jgi:hypothetical protein